MDGRIGGLLLRLILAGGLAELGAGGGDVEHVVHDLKGEPQRLTRHRQRAEGLAAGAGQPGPHRDGRADQRRRLVQVDVVQHVGADPLPLRLQIGHLPRHHAIGARGVGQIHHHVAEDGAVHARPPAVGEQAEGVREQAVTGQDGHGLAEHLVAGGAAAAIVVVVHRGQVVVDERIGVDHLQRAGRRQHRLHPAAHRLRPRDHQHRAQPLPPREDAVAHGAVKGGGRAALGGQDALERRVHRARAVLHVGLEIEAHPCLSSSHVEGLRAEQPALVLGEELDALLRFLEVLRAAAGEPHPFLEGLQRLLEGQVAGFERVHDLLEPRQRVLKLDVGHLAPSRPSRARPARLPPAGPRSRRPRAPAPRSAPPCPTAETRQAVPAPQHRERRERLETPHRGAEPMPRDLGAMGGRRGKPAAELGEHRGAVGNPSQRVLGTQGVCGELRAMAQRPVMVVDGGMQARGPVVQPPRPLAEHAAGLGEHAAARQPADALAPLVHLPGHAERTGARRARSPPGSPRASRAPPARRRRTAWARGGRPRSRRW